jgi:ADP-ribose pyrophosphatase
MLVRLRLVHYNHCKPNEKESCLVNQKQFFKISHLEMGPNGPETIGQGGFLTLLSCRMRNVFTDGNASDWYQLECVSPPFNDAVVLILYAPLQDGEVLVAMRRGVRPNLTLRSRNQTLLKIDGEALTGITWELPAGGVEPQDLVPGGAGFKGRAVLEAWEEAGLKIKQKDLFPLGPPSFSAPAICYERLHFLAAKVDPEAAQPPPGDGHPMEQGGGMSFISLKEALEWCCKGRIMDLKSEVGLKRLAELLASESS